MPHLATSMYFSLFLNVIDSNTYFSFSICTGFKLKTFQLSVHCLNCWIMHLANKIDFSELFWAITFVNSIPGKVLLRYYLSNFSYICLLFYFQTMAICSSLMSYYFSNWVFEKKALFKRSIWIATWILFFFSRLWIFFFIFFCCTFLLPKI